MPRILRSLVRPLAFVSLWLTSVGFFETAYCLSGKRQPSDVEVFDFAAAFALAAATAAIITLALGGKRRWAMEAALSAALPVAATLVGAYLLFWPASSLVQPLLGMKPGDFLRFRQEFLEVTTKLIGLTVPTGAILGIGLGIIAGLSLLLARRRPRLVGWFVVGLLIACVADSVHVTAFGRVTDLVVKARLEGLNTLVVSWYIRDELASALGATAGAVVGAVVAGVVAWARGGRQPLVRPSSPPRPPGSPDG